MDNFVSHTNADLVHPMACWMRVSYVIDGLSRGVLPLAGHAVTVVALMEELSI